jgi:hypothetical protein
MMSSNLCRAPAADRGNLMEDADNPGPVGPSVMMGWVPMASCLLGVESCHCRQLVPLVEMGAVSFQFRVWSS